MLPEFEQSVKNTYVFSHVPIILRNEGGRRGFIKRPGDFFKFMKHFQSFILRETFFFFSSAEILLFFDICEKTKIKKIQNRELFLLW